MKPVALLVTSPAKEKNNFWTCSITSPVGSLMPPCDLASIAAVLREKGVEPVILDIRLFDDPMGALLEAVRRIRPEAIITNLGTASAMEDYEIFRATKTLVPKRIAFCFHAMALPEEVFSIGATHILAGDPEYAAAEAVLGLPSEKGLWTPENFTTPPGYVEPLDSLPLPALDLIDVKVYHSIIMGKEPFSILLANRGCLFSCTYCVIPFLLGRKYRALSVTRIVDEIERDVNTFGIRKFFFIDSALNLKLEWLQGFCEEVLRRGLDIKWCGNMRVSPINIPLLQLMKRSGCFRIFFGVEDLDLIKELNRKTTREDTRQAFAMCREAGIETVAFTILNDGLDATESAMAKRIVNMVAELRADALQCNIAIPYPGSAMFEDYKTKYDMPTDWSRYDPAGFAPPVPSDLDLVKARRLVYLHYFLRNPKYLWKTFCSTDLRSLYSFAHNSIKVLWHNPARTQAKSS
ncbi:MAG: B12-binding domain-containing radical SAM protein [Humidesulfovibrio sp.]|nr:B12-binding domain-containing radical SAM protein [Humidesulfovibrio sp.]